MRRPRPALRRFRLPSIPPLAHTVALAVTLTAPLAAQLGPTGTAFWNEGSPDLVSSLQADARFGHALAAGDFDCDGFDDLAIGVPEDDDNNGALADVGYVMVLYGSETGPAAGGHQLWDQQSFEAAEEADDHFSETLAAGDFDGDGCADLAIGAPQEDVGSETDAGAIFLLYGGESGLTSGGNQVFRQGAGGISAAAEAFDNFGAALAVGDYDDDGIDDLAVGTPGEDIEAEKVNGAGALHILYGHASGGLSGDDDLVLFRGGGLVSSPIENEGIGRALAAGDFLLLLDGDELAIGTPGGDVDELVDAGRVLMLSDIGGSNFLGVYSQDTTDVPGIAEEFDNFGETLAAGDFDGDGGDELAVGAPGEDQEGPDVNNIGAVIVLDFDGDAMELLTQADFAPETADPIDEFGSALAAGDFDADGADDLAIGVPLEDLGPIATAGMVHVIHGTTTQIVAAEGALSAGKQTWIQTIDPSEDGDRFGFALAAGRFSGHSGADLAIGVPTETLGADTDAGGVNLLFSEALFLDGFESEDTSAWSGTAE